MQLSEQPFLSLHGRPDLYHTMANWLMAKCKMQNNRPRLQARERAAPTLIFSSNLDVFLTTNWVKFLNSFIQLAQENELERTGKFM